MRRRFQRCKDDGLRSVFRTEYSATLSAFRRSTARAREAYLRGFCAECAQRSVFSAPYKEAFGRRRADLILPPLLREDGTDTSTHLEAAALLLQTQVAVDYRASDQPEHEIIHWQAQAPYWTRPQDAPFSQIELEVVVRQMRDRSAPRPGRDNAT
ncbi:hypothetical protein MRX96_057019 [Rhipicephalus microplus]